MIKVVNDVNQIKLNPGCCFYFWLKYQLQPGNHRMINVTLVTRCNTIICYKKRLKMAYLHLTEFKIKSVTDVTHKTLTPSESNTMFYNIVHANLAVNQTCYKRFTCYTLSLITPRVKMLKYFSGENHDFSRRKN